MSNEIQSQNVKIVLNFWPDLKFGFWGLEFPYSPRTNEAAGRSITVIIQGWGSWDWSSILHAPTKKARHRRDFLV